MFSNNLHRVKNDCHKVIGIMSAICVLLGSRYGTNQIISPSLFEFFSEFCIEER